MNWCSFPPRHNALGPNDIRAMLDTCKAKDINDLMDTAMPKTLPRVKRMNLGIYTDGMTEAAFLEHFKYAPTLHICVSGCYVVSFFLVRDVLCVMQSLP